MLQIQQKSCNPAATQTNGNQSKAQKFDSVSYRRNI